MKPCRRLPLAPDAWLTTAEWRAMIREWGPRRFATRRRRLARLCAAFSTVVASLLLVPGCSNSTVAWRSEGGPTIVYCQDPGDMLTHGGWTAAERQSFTERGVTVRGEYVPPVDTVYLLVAHPDEGLTIDEALTLAHELQHRADRRYHGNMWAQLSDLGHNHHTPGRESIPDNSPAP